MPKTSHKIRTNNAGYCFVEIDHARIYLGRKDDPNTLRQYHAVLAQHLANTQETNSAFGEPPLATIAKRYIAHCKTYYAGSSQSHIEIGGVEQCIEFVGADYPPRDFGPKKLKAFRDHLVARGLCLGTVNARIGTIKRMFRWAASEELLPASLHVALMTLTNLKAGRSDAVEYDAVTPVSLEHVGAVRPFVSRQVWALIQLQLMTAARPGEIVGLRPCDIDQTGDVWIVRLESHKTAYKGKSRTLYLGAQAQAILAPWLDGRELDIPLFSPREAEASRYAAAGSHRREGQAPSIRIGSRVIGESYDVAAYRRAIQRACRIAGIPQWHPHQLRHTAATTIRKAFDLEAAQVALGHSSADITQIYAERDESLALKVFAQIG